MRILRHEWIQEDIIFDRKKVNVLVLENQRFFRQFILKTINQIEEGEEFLICSDDKKELSLSKCAAIITDCFEVPIDEKKCLTLLYKDLEKKITENTRIGIEKINNSVINLLDDFLLDYPLPLTYDPTLTLSAILKATNVRPNFIPENFLQALIERIKTVSVLFKKDIFFLVNLHDYLLPEEITQFYKEVALLDIDIVIIDGREPKSRNPNEKITIIDADLCEILK